MKVLSIVIPVYNEEKTILKVLDRVLKAKLGVNKEIIIVDDGSSDNSRKLIEKFLQDMPKKKGLDIKFYSKKNGGKGSAVRFGMERCKGDILTIQDADLEYDPKDYVKLLEPILDGKYQATYGSRYLSQQGHLKENQHMIYKIHLAGNWLLSFITSLLYRTKITDMETCYKMITREVYDKLDLVSDDFNIEPEITSQIIKLGYKIKEFPISYYSRDYKEGKKITWIHGIKALFSLIKWRFA